MLFLPAWCASLLFHEVKLRKISSSLHAEPDRLAAASAAVVPKVLDNVVQRLPLRVAEWWPWALLELQYACFIVLLAEHVHD